MMVFSDKYTRITLEVKIIQKKQETDFCNIHVLLNQNKTLF